MIILIGTKSDQQHEVTMEEGLKMMKKMGGIFYVETSAETGEQIDEVNIILSSFSIRQQSLCTKNLKFRMNFEYWLNHENIVDLLF